MSRLVLATDDVAFEARVREAFEGQLTGPLRYWRDDMLTDQQHTVDDLSRSGVDVVAIGPDFPPDAALELASAFDRERPDISVLIVAPPSRDILQSALRAGARDVITPDMPALELRGAVERAFESASNRRAAFEGGEESGNGPNASHVIVSLCPKGGAGKTTVSTNIALALAQVAPGEVVIIDLDLQFGDVASALGLKPDLSFADATRSLDTLDATGLKANLTHHPDEQLYVLCAPATPAEADELNVKQVERVIELLMESFKYVVIDTASGLDENTLAALEYATDLILLSATDVPSVRATLKEIDALRAIGNTHQRWHFVLNRADARTGLTIPAIEKAVGINVDVAIPSSRSVPVSLNQGEPVVVTDPRSPVSLAMHQLARRFTPNEGSSNGKAGIFRRR